MRVTGIAVGFIDVPEEHTQAYNRWYDLDHVPENLALPEITGARRYVATPELVAARPPSLQPELSDGAGKYFTTYLLGTEDLAQATESWHALGDRLRRAGRFFRHGRAPYAGVYRLERAVARPGVPVAPEAVPHLGHRGAFVALSRVADPARRAEADRWYEEVHFPDLLDVPGVLAALRLSRFEMPDEGRFMSLYLLDGDPATVAAEWAARRRDLVARGRMPSPDSSRSLFFAPYRRVTPLVYEFA
jgi:hypothetical protein